MDADGEDSPLVIPELLVHKHKDIVNVVRGSRNESFLFKCGYFIYRALFRLATGNKMNFGNFCLVNRKVLELAIESNFSHFPAFLSKQDCSRQYIVAGKQARLGGTSKMGFRKHLQHAARSFAEYGLRITSRTHTDKPIYDLHR